MEELNFRGYECVGTIRFNRVAKECKQMDSKSCVYYDTEMG